MHKINLLIDDKTNWRKKVPNLEKFVNRTLKSSVNSISAFKFKNIELTVLLTNTKNVKSLNFKYRKKNKDTDILSFPWEDKKFYKGKINKKNIYLGDLAISYNYIKKQEENFEVYLKKIMIHGFLHLIGYDHDNKKNYLKMEEKQKKILTL